MAEKILGYGSLLTISFLMLEETWPAVIVATTAIVGAIIVHLKTK